MAMLHPWMLPLSFVKQPCRKCLINLSISIHALWLVYFKKHFFFSLTYYLAITKTKKAKKKKNPTTKIVYNYFIITNKD